MKMKKWEAGADEDETPHKDPVYEMKNMAGLVRYRVRLVKRNRKSPPYSQKISGSCGVSEDKVRECELASFSADSVLRPEFRFTESRFQCAAQ